MKRPYREHHLLEILESFDEQTLPLDIFLSNYFRAHKSLGAKDRQVIADTCYGMIRWMGLLDYFIEGAPSWEKRLEIYQKIPLTDCFEKEEIPLYTRISFPEPLFDLIRQSHGEKLAVDICRASNTAAPATIRVNPCKTTREDILKNWDGLYQIEPCKEAPFGISFLKKINFFSLEEFKKGLFEIQDEGSQLLAELICPSPGDLVLDYCSGSGGKTLAFAYKMQGKGQIFLHDIRPFILREAKKRLKRAGIQNAQIVQENDPKLKKLKKKMDWVLVDAPCSGTGTLRRNPDMKWRFTKESLDRLLGQQRAIFEKALSFLAPEGKIVYATCSLLQEENQKQVEHFIKTYHLQLEGKLFQTLPQKNGCDGFFGAVLKKQDV